jgi:hypothetical protein
VTGRDVRPKVVRVGDVQFVEMEVASPGKVTVAEFRHTGGSDVYVRTPDLTTGARSQGVRILRSRASASGLTLLVEGLNGRSYDLFLRTPRQMGDVKGGTLVRQQTGDPMIRVNFEGEAGKYSRRDVVVSLQ